MGEHNTVAWYVPSAPNSISFMLYEPVIVFQQGYTSPGSDPQTSSITFQYKELVNHTGKKYNSLRW